MKEFDFFSGFRAYAWDLPLLRDLGLRPFSGKVWEEIYIGHVTRDDSIVFVWVTGAPEQFWRFAIVDFGNYQTHLVTTGSGSLRDYWPLIEKMAQGMIGANEVRFSNVPDDLRKYMG